MSKRNRSAFERIGYSTAAAAFGGALLAPLLELDPVDVATLTAGITAFRGAIYLMPAKKRNSGGTAALAHSILSGFGSRRNNSARIPADVSQSVHNAGLKMFGKYLATKIPQNIFLQWLEDVERYESAIGRGTGLSANRWKLGLSWGDSRQPSYWKPSYDDTCMTLLATAEHFHRTAGILETFGNGWTRLRHNAALTYAFVYLAEERVHYSQAPRVQMSTAQYRNFIRRRVTA